MKNIKILLIIVLLYFISSCKKHEEIDKTPPSIDLTIQDAFPLNCDTLYFDESFDFKVLFKDNVELGSNTAFSIDIHNNFNHHSHSTEVTECNLSPVKEPINPFINIESFNIPAGQSEYITNLSIKIPSGNENGTYDEGEYHFFISVTDKQGWSAQKGLSIRILHR